MSDYDGGDEGPDEGGADPGGDDDDDDDDDDDAPGGDGGHRGGRGPGGDGGDGDDGGDGSGDDGGDDGGATAEPQKRRSRGRRPWPRYAPRPSVQNQRLFKCADRVPRGFWGSLCGAQQKSLLRVLRGYGHCLRRGSAERRARREAELVARERRYWEDMEKTASTCIEPVHSWMNVVFVVAPSEEVSLDWPLACDAVDSARPVSVPQDPLAAGCQTKVCGTRTAVLPDVAWQLSCLEYGLEQRVDGRLVCVDGAVMRDCPRSVLLGDDAALIAECVELLFGTCAVIGREQVHAANGIAGAAETAYVEEDMAARRDVAHSHARLCKTQHGYVKKDPAYLAGRHRGVHGFLHAEGGVVLLSWRCATADASSLCGSVPRFGWFRSEWYVY